MTRALTPPAYPKQRAHALTQGVSGFLDAVDISRNRPSRFTPEKTRAATLGFAQAVDSAKKNNAGKGASTHNPTSISEPIKEVQTHD